MIFNKEREREIIIIIIIIAIINYRDLHCGLIGDRRSLMGSTLGLSLSHTEGTLEWR